MKALPLLAWVSLLALVACGGGGDVAACNSYPTFSGAPMMTGIKSSSGNLNLSISIDPQTTPLERRCFALQYVITDSSGTPVDGLTLAVQPWMVQMNHGSPATPTVTGAGAGTYVVTSVDLYMEGEWLLQTNVSGPMTDTFTPTLQVN